MLFDQIYRVLSYLVSTLFFGIFCFASYEMYRRLEFRSVSMFELLLALAFLFAAICITWYSIYTRKLGLKKNFNLDLIDHSGEQKREISKLNNSLFFFLSFLSIILALAITGFFGYGFVKNFMNGREINHFNILAFVVLSAVILFGIAQLIYTIRMILFQISLKQEKN